MAACFQPADESVLDTGVRADTSITNPEDADEYEMSLTVETVTAKVNELRAAVEHAPTVEAALQKDLAMAQRKLAKLRGGAHHNFEEHYETKEGGTVDVAVAEEPIFDFAIITPACAEMKYAQTLEAKLKAAGFITRTFHSHCLQDEQAVTGIGIALPPERLREFADAINAPGRLNPLKLKEACAALDPPIDFARRAVGGHSLAEVSKQGGLYPPFLHIYAPYECDKPELYEPFDAHARHKLTLRLLGARSDLPDVDGKPCAARGAQLNVRSMDSCAPFKEEDDLECTDATLILLHERLDNPDGLRAKLDAEWINGGWKSNLPWNCPNLRIRNYFGDQVGFYYVFLSTFTTHCVPVGLIGIIISLAFYLTNPGQSTMRQLPVVFFAPWITIFMTIGFAHFRRRQSTFMKEWGCLAWIAGGKVAVRPDFDGTPQTDPIDGHIAIDFPHAIRSERTRQAWAVIAFLLCVVTFAISIIFIFKFWAAGNDLPFIGVGKPVQPFWGTYGDQIGAAGNVFQVQLLNLVYEQCATALTHYENWRTDAEYSNNLIAKLFLFKFFNTFASIFYVAFGKEKMEGGCEPTGCIDALSGQVMLLFLSGAAISLGVQLILPAIKKKQLERKTGDNYGDKATFAAQVEEQFIECGEYDTIEGPIGDFMELAIQFGYLACFGASFPVSPLMCFVLNMLQMKQDGYKLLHLSRRPLAMEVSGIGVWENIYLGILFISIFTNAGLALFTSKLLTDWTLYGRVWAYIIVTTIACAVVGGILKAVPPVSNAVATQFERQKTYVSRVVQGVEVDDVYDEGEAEPDQGPEREPYITAQHAED